MSFDSVFRHVVPTSPASPIAPAASGSTSSSAVLGLTALAGAVAYVVWQHREREAQPAELDAPDVIDTTGHAVAPSPREEVAAWGRELTHQPPVWAVDSALWDNAERQVRPYWDRYEQPWAVVAHVYEAMGGRTSR